MQCIREQVPLENHYANGQDPSGGIHFCSLSARVPVVHPPGSGVCRHRLRSDEFDYGFSHIQCKNQRDFSLNRPVDFLARRVGQRTRASCPRTQSVIKDDQNIILTNLCSGFFYKTQQQVSCLGLIW
eukprot:Plantae.Rhodophyta-Rhodochaete_pulchella.ctg7244.p1 GENE.Plantae.Rhodophyta-Rhodochaete_pulchella.ctg7244~~Plantae.Rhodophyta-Rhodochaete_pulchella.ctg7244.p1  ORF type:complete len:127 (-),score=0.07 Plantae.Rhodophyta-Rhodochaete_pulchella.ctg7244:558-938(-)